MLDAGLNAVHTAVEIAPTVEEVAKLLPLLFYFAVFGANAEDMDLAFVMVAVGFATMKSAFYLGDAGLSDPGTLLIRGLGTSMMYVACGVVVGYGLTRAWRHPRLRAAGTFGLLFLTSTYHGIFNLLVAAGGAARVSAVVLPLATLMPLLAIRRRRERSEGR
jgi:RsiW-degrading membrane proteinase PrsW (M82 family)